MQIRDGPEQRENLLQAHHKLSRPLGQRHDHIFSGILRQKVLLSGQMGDGADVGETTSNYRLGVVFCVRQACNEVDPYRQGGDSSTQHKGYRL